MTKAYCGREYADAITEQVINAKNSIKMLVYDWRWYSNDPFSKIQKFTYEVIKQAGRGVSVECLVNADFMGAHLKSTKVNVKQVDTKKIMHAKMIIIDDKILATGSHNLTKNGFELNHEMSIITDDSEVVARGLAFFTALK